MKKIISVIIPIYNVEKFLKDCLDSVINQTYENLEIILVDDGSTDACPEICDEYQKKDSRIRVIHKKNGGLSDARNAGIEIATGKYITFIDSDDFIFPNMVANLYNLCEKYQADFSMCQCMHGNEKDTLDTIVYPKKDVHINVFENQEKMRAYLVSREIDTVAWKKLYNINLFHNLRFPKGKLHEDAFVTHILIDKANKVVVTNEVGYMYRINPQSIMNNGFSIKRLDSIEAKLEQLKYIKEKHPHLCLYACAGVIYACNFCIKDMTLKGYLEKETEQQIQKLYRKYTLQYLKAENVSLKGKTISLLAFVNTRLARFMIRSFLL